MIIVDAKAGDTNACFDNVNQNTFKPPLDDAFAAPHPHHRRRRRYLFNK